MQYWNTRNWKDLFNQGFNWVEAGKHHRQWQSQLNRFRTIWQMYSCSSLKNAFWLIPLFVGQFILLLFKRFLQDIKWSTSPASEDHQRKCSAERYTVMTAGPKNKQKYLFPSDFCLFLQFCSWKKKKLCLGSPRDASALRHVLWLISVSLVSLSSVTSKN